MTLDSSQGDQRAGARAPALHPGDPRQVGGVRLLGRLGEGGMGVAFLGEAGDGRLVCVKIIRAEYARDALFRARFEAEASAARRVARFCTAQVLDAGTDGDLAYLVTEYIEGPTLTAAVAQDGPMTGSTLDSLAIGIAAALNGIHAAGVVHRDLKPSNVLLSRVGPKVIDFGIARALDALEHLTESGNVVGTPSYMAPEQFRGATTTATDVFSWGAVVTFAATGRPPFATGTPYQLMHRITSDAPDLGALEGPLRGLVGRALDKEPARRPSARALLLALVGDEADPIDASSRIISTQWTAPTLLDDTGAAGPLLDRPLVERPSRRGRLLLGIAAVALVGAIVATLAIQDWDRGNPGGAGRPSGGASTSAGSSASTSDASAGPPASTVDASTGPLSTVDGEPSRTVTIGARVPPEGFVTLGIGDVHRYRLHVDAPLAVYVTGEACNDLVPWQLLHAGAGLVARDTLGCRQHGPYTLGAGDYDLVVGAPREGGRYALRISGR